MIGLLFDDPDAPTICFLLFVYAVGIANPEFFAKVLDGDFTPKGWLRLAIGALMILTSYWIVDKF